MAESVRELVHRLITDVRSLFREELMLVKTELKQNAKECARDGAAMALGGAAAFAGTLVLIIAFAFLFAWLISMAGLPMLLSCFLGFTASGLITAGAGAFLFFGGLNRLRQQKLAPEKSIEALQQYKTVAPGTPMLQSETVVPQTKAEEHQRRVFSAERSVQATLSEIKQHLSPRAARARIRGHIADHRYALSTAAMAMGVLATWLVRRRRAHA